MRGLVFTTGLLCAAPLASHAAEPSLTHVHPAGAHAGATTAVKLAGKFDPWPCKVWADAPGIAFTPAKDAGRFDVVVDAAMKPGPHLIRAFNDEGASAPVSIVISAQPETLEVEPNDAFQAPQVLASSTAVVNGRLDKADDVDSFLVTLKKGQTMVAWVEATVLAAGFDAMLRITDAAGVTLAFNHDYVSMDPLLVFEAPQDGGFVVQTTGPKFPAASDIRFAGGEDCVYRLHVSTAPLVRNTWPLVVQRGKKSPVTLEGWNLATTTAEIDAASPPPFPVTFSDVPEVVESAEPQTLAVPSAVSGRIQTPGHEDRFAFAATKDAKLEFTLAASSLGSRMDPWLRLLDKDGKELTTNDDGGPSGEARLVWAAPADGTFTAVVGDLTRQAGSDIFYRLQIAPVVPGVSANVAAHSAKVEAGKSAELKVTVAFTHGFQTRLKLAARNLPPGLTAAEVDVPEKGGEVTLSLAAAADAARTSAPFQLVLREIEGGRERPVSFSMASTSEDNGVPKGYPKLLINTTDQLWLTVTPPPAPPPAPPPPPAK